MFLLFCVFCLFLCALFCFPLFYAIPYQSGKKKKKIGMRPQISMVNNKQIHLSVIVINNVNRLIVALLLNALFMAELLIGVLQNFGFFLGR